MKVLLTGASGLIGKTVLKIARRQNIEVIATDMLASDPATGIVACDLRDSKAVDSLFEANDLDAVIHCGALSGPMMAAGQPMLMAEVNIIGTMNIMEAARRNNVSRLVLCSSISVYGDTGHGIDMSEGMALHPTSVYGGSKVAVEAIFDGYKAEYGMTGVCYRIGRIYGPYRGGNCAIKQMVDGWRSGAKVVITAEPGFLYHYIYSEDVASALLMAAQVEEIPSTAYNLGSDEPVEMSTVVEIAKKCLPGLDVEIKLGPDIVPDVNHGFSSQLLQKELGFKAEFNLERGIRAYSEAE